ncbi:DUF2237 family protein [Psychrobacter sp. FDAARGOS_221]|uniref:DUF2237 family protein n=1 Tax=Psychrobacter sp. FDAARGOS_221 TaxID=1975705 RepID=UPI000BB5376B|nr:DUF2237 domain-containing protein [Psychrobacter sp. FDAARGOS_221]PNK61930.1 DUF2237 domain-containing protein [Psychrobacter sp. FDAARGOS_221]
MSSPHPDPQLNQRNVLGTALASCCFDPITGFYRNGFCHTGPQDVGLHTVCAKMTSEFLNFSVKTGNDLVTPMPEFGFPGLKAGDYWCVCALRWLDALDHGVAPNIKLEACHESLLELVDIETLKRYSL